MSQGFQLQETVEISQGEVPRAEKAPLVQFLRLFCFLRLKFGPPHPQPHRRKEVQMHRLRFQGSSAYTQQKYSKKSIVVTFIVAYFERSLIPDEMILAQEVTKFPNDFSDWRSQHFPAPPDASHW